MTQENTLLGPDTRDQKLHRFEAKIQRDIQIAASNAAIASELRAFIARNGYKVDDAADELGIARGRFRRKLTRYASRWSVTEILHASAVMFDGDEMRLFLIANEAWRGAEAEAAAAAREAVEPALAR